MEDQIDSGSKPALNRSMDDIDLGEGVKNDENQIDA